MKMLTLIAVLMATCSSLPQRQDNKPTPLPARRQFQLSIPKEVWEPIFFETIDERARISNLRSLRVSALPDNDLEVRVWNGFGVTALEGFVLRRTGGKWLAMHLDGIHPKLPRRDYQRILPPPKSGWDVFWQRLQEAGVLTLPDAAAVGCSTGVTDGMSYVVEYNYDRAYRTYLYDNPGYAECDEAKRMIALGNLISEEFGVPEMATK
jgi:hypothetical protein